MKTVELSFITKDNYSFFGPNAVMYFVSKWADGSISVLNADPVMPSLVTTASHVYLEVSTDREKIVGLELVCVNILQGQADVRLKLDHKLPFGIF